MKLDINFFLVLILFIIVGCKTNQTYLNKKDCFYMKDGFVYINFYNSSDEAKLIANISSIIDSNYYLLKNNYTLVNDTLIIELASKKNINISDVEPTYNINIKDSILLDKRKQIQQVFKNDLKFNTIQFSRNDKKTVINKCH